MKIKLLACALGLALVSCITVVSPTPATGGNVTGPTGGNRNAGSQNNTNYQNQRVSHSTSRADSIAAFRRADTTNGGDGEWSFYECKALADESGEGANIDSIWANYRRYDWDSNGKISEEEFLAAEGF